MAKKRLKCCRITSTLAQETIRESVAELMRGQDARARLLADATDETPECLFATRAPETSTVRPHGEDVVVELRLQLLDASTEFGRDIRVEWRTEMTFDRVEALRSIPRSDLLS